MTHFYTCLIITYISIFIVCNPVERDNHVYKTFVDGQEKSCRKCDPGYRLVNHCHTDFERATCIPCLTGTYQSHYNNVKYCEGCSTSCPDNTIQEQRQEIIQPCTLIHDRVCACKSGYFKREGSTGICKPWTKCSPGQWMKTPGTRITDSVCENCTICEQIGTSKNCSTAYNPACGMKTEPTVTANTTTADVTNKNKEDKRYTETVAIVLGAGAAGVLIFGMLTYCCIKKNCPTYIERFNCPWRSKRNVFTNVYTGGEEGMPVNGIGAGCFINTTRDPTEPVLDVDTKSKAAKSVGYIYFQGMSATCYRVGTNKVITCLHVIKRFLTAAPNIRMLPVSELSKCYVVFNHVDKRVEITDIDKIYLKPLESEDELLFANEETDCIVLELICDQRNLPPPFICFGSPCLDKNVHIITHANRYNNIKHIDVVLKLIDVKSNQTKEDIKFVKTESKTFLRCNVRNPSRFKYDSVNEFDRVDNEKRYLFHCLSNQSGSGSPGIQNSQGTPVVVFMLVHGYPDWYYEPELESVRDKWPKEYCIEQGVSMALILQKIMNSNPALYKEIVPSG